MSRQIIQILKLSDAFTAHTGLEHWTISKRIVGKGDLIDRLKKGADLTTRTAERLIQGFSDIWPEDLEWPSDIPRPAKSKRKVA